MQILNFYDALNNPSNIKHLKPDDPIDYIAPLVHIFNIDMFVGSLSHSACISISYRNIKTKSVYGV